MVQEVLELNCAVKTYAWGKIGDASEVAQLASSQPAFTVDQTSPYAELWMGTHPQGPSTIHQKEDSQVNESLKDYIERNPVVIGEHVEKKFGANLPFLFKVLSVNKALSIQAHPTKDLAKKLHEQFPDKYKDPNHKPEMAIALTKFEALCGFRPVDEILGFMANVPELLNVIGKQAHDKLMKANQSPEADRDNLVGNALKECFHNLMTCDSNTVENELKSYINRLKEHNNEDKSNKLGELFLRIHNDFPGDIGCFIIFILNYIQLEPSESIFLGPNVPHAYLSGDIIECMACSDNVVRAGLTIKFKDVNTLVNMLNYSPQTVEETKFRPQKEDSFTDVYNPPVEDFTVKKIYIPSNSCDRYALKSISGPSIILVMDGQAKISFTSDSNDGGRLNLERGKVFFVPCCATIAFEEIEKSKDLIVFQAFCEI